MVRRVKSYLNNMKVITEEDLLHKMSLDVESPPGGNYNTTMSSTSSYGNMSQSNSQQSLQKRSTSPTPSAMSSASSNSHHSDRKLTPPNSNSTLATTTSNGAPKFGAASPQAVKKLLSLSETRKPRVKTNSSASSSSQRDSSITYYDSPVTLPVDLTPESSSVAPILRKKNYSSGHHRHHHHRHHRNLDYSSVMQGPPEETDFHKHNQRVSKQHIKNIPSAYYVMSQDEDDEDTQISAV